MHDPGMSLRLMVLSSMSLLPVPLTSWALLVSTVQLILLFFQVHPVSATKVTVIDPSLGCVHPAYKLSCLPADHLVKSQVLSDLCYTSLDFYLIIITRFYLGAMTAPVLSALMTLN